MATVFELTEAEKRCISAFRRAKKKTAPLQPTVQEVADEMGVTKGRAGQLCGSLKRKGKFVSLGRKSRSLMLASRAAH